MIRTTIRLDEELFKDARKRAIDERVAFTQVVNEALSIYLCQPRRVEAKRKTGIDFLKKLANYGFKGGPRNLAKNHDKYTWE